MALTLLLSKARLPQSPPPSGTPTNVEEDQPAKKLGDRFCIPPHGWRQRRPADCQIDCQPRELVPLPATFALFM
jgi:hypothetical protein